MSETSRCNASETRRPVAANQADQGRICFGPKRVGRWKPRGGKDKAGNLVARINVRDATRLPIAEVVHRWRFVPGVLRAKVLSKETHGLVADVSLRDRSRLAGPVNGRCCADMRLLLIGREPCKAAQEIFGIAESEADGTPHGKIGFDSRDHRITPGHG